VHLQQIFRALATAQPDSGTDTEKSLAGLAGRFHQRGLLILISDLLDDTERIISALKGFRHRRNEIIVFHLLAPEEREFPYRENIEFADAETGALISAQSSYIAGAYRAGLEAHTEKISGFCSQNNIDFVPLTTSDLLSAALLAYLSKRQKA
jgi:uncharacterized protein (DUF58 family)